MQAIWETRFRWRSRRRPGRRTCGKLNQIWQVLTKVGQEESFEEDIIISARPSNLERCKNAFFPPSPPSLFLNGLSGGSNQARTTIFFSLSENLIFYMIKTLNLRVSSEVRPKSTKSRPEMARELPRGRPKVDPRLGQRSPTHAVDFVDAVHAPFSFLSFRSGFLLIALKQKRLLVGG